MARHPGWCGVVSFGPNRNSTFSGGFGFESGKKYEQ